MLKENLTMGKWRGHLDGRVNLEYHWLLLLKKSHIRSVALSLITHYSLLITLYYHYTSADF